MSNQILDLISIIIIIQKIKKQTKTKATCQNKGNPEQFKVPKISTKTTVQNKGKPEHFKLLKNKIKLTPQNKWKPEQVYRIFAISFWANNQIWKIENLQTNKNKKIEQKIRNKENNKQNQNRK